MAFDTLFRMQIKDAFRFKPKSAVALALFFANRFCSSQIRFGREGIYYWINWRSRQDLNLHTA